jgi:hypothetical protein
MVHVPGGAVAADLPEDRVPVLVLELRPAAHAREAPDSDHEVTP